MRKSGRSRRNCHKELVIRIGALTFLGGILLGLQAAAPPSLWWGLLLIPLGILAWRRPSWLAAVFFIAGVMWLSLRAGAILEDSLPPELEGKDLLVEGYIADIPRKTGYGLRFKLDVAHASRDGKTVRIPRKILLSISHPAFDPRVGERWRLRVRLKRPHGFQNPGGFDYEGYLFRNRIRAKGYVRARQQQPELVETGSFIYAIGRLRQNLGERIRALLPDNGYAGIITALANGDRRGITDAQWQVLRRTGTLHLVAISGLHISLVAGLVFFLARWAWALPGTTVLRWPAPVVGAACAIAAAAGYAMLAGFVIPTQRALIMLTVAMSGILLRRRIAPSQLLAIALFLVLVHDPLAVMAPGFWLSFAAVAVIILAVQGDSTWRLTRREGSMGRVDSGIASVWRKWGAIQWSIAVGMFPLLLLLYQQVALSAPFANMLAVPVFSLMVVPLTLTGVVALGVSETFAGLIFQAAAWVLQALWQALEYVSALEYSQWIQHRPATWTLAAAFIGIALLLAPRGWPARWMGAVWLLPMFLVRPPGPAAGEVWFALLDVGQGLAAVVRTQDHVLVYDTGPRFSASFDTGAAVVVPYLRAKGVARIDTLLISHGDNDHVGGAESVLRAFPVARVVSGVPDLSVTGQPCRAGQTWNWDGVAFAVLNPAGAGSGKSNNASCVLMVRSRFGNILLPGDIEDEAEQRLIEREGRALSADILVAPHHGSKTSSSQAFIDMVKPRFVLFPVGYRNRYRHPNKKVVERYNRLDAELYDSPTTGAVEFRLRAGGMEMAIYRQEHPRFWFTQ